MTAQSLFRRPIRWIVLVALAVPTGFVAIAEDQTQPDRGRRHFDDDRPRRGQREHRRPEHGPGQIHRLLRGIDPTEEQREQFKSIFKGHREKRQKAMEEHRDRIEEIDRQIQELVKQKQELLGGGPKQLLDQIKTVLTDDQLEQLDLNIERGRRHREGDQMGSPRRHGKERGDRSFHRRPRHGGEDDMPQLEL